MKLEPEQERYIELIRNKLPNKIKSEFIEKYYGKLAQAKLGMKKLGEYEDALLMNGLASIDCSDIDFSELTQEEFEHIPFDSFTIFSESTNKKFHPKQILEKGKKFGLGIDRIPLTGDGIHVAIIDQDCNPYLVDADIVEYDRGNSIDFGENDVEHMHGKTVISLLASKSCGVAKKAKIHFFSDDYYDEKSLVQKRSDLLQRIVDYNNSSDENDKILVVSGSWRMPSSVFEKYQSLLKETGCELICANNFDKYFSEFTNNDNKIEIPLDLSNNELEKLYEDFTEFDKNIIQKQVNKKRNVKIPISRTYHQVGEKEGFKYQSVYSTSWGIPQVAGLYALFKEKDRSLTFDEFCEFAEKTAFGDIKIINPRGIYQEIDKKLLKNIDTSNVSIEKLVSNALNNVTSMDIKDNIINRDEGEKSFHDI